MPFLKTLLSFFTRSDKRFSIFLLAMMLLTAVIELAGIGSLFPYIKILGDKSFIHKNSILNSIYQFFQFNDDNEFLIFVGCLIFVMLVLKAFMATLNNYFQAKLTYRINNRLSEYCLNSYMNMPYIKAIDKNSSILSKHLLLDVSSVSTMIQAVLTVLTDVIVAIALVILMISVDPILVLSVVAFLGCLLLLMNRFLKPRIDTLSIANERSNRFAYQTAIEALSNLKDAKIYNVQPYFIKRYLKWQYQIAKQMTEFSVISNLPTNILNVMGFGVLLIVLLYLIITRGNLMAILPMIGLIAVSVQRLLPSASRISISIANIRRYKPLVYVVRDAMNFFQQQDIQENKESTQEVIHFNDALALENVTYRYPATSVNALTDISLTLRKNSTLGIVGESGAGKSTLIDVLLGLLSVESGRIFCDGKELSRDKECMLSHLVGYVPQQVGLLDASIQENIAFGVPVENIDKKALENAIAIAQLESLIDQLPEGLQTPIGEKGVKISGGQRQRIGIARALYRDPDILIMDEATNALDAATEKEFNYALNALIHKKTLIVIAHRLSSVSICEHIIQLEKGRIVAAGSFEELSKHSESFRRIYNLSDAPVVW